MTHPATRGEATGEGVGAAGEALRVDAQTEPAVLLQNTGQSL